MTPSRPRTDWAAVGLPDPPVTPLRWQGGWQDGALALLDQTCLPGDEHWLTRRAHGDVVSDIQRLAVRGAPVIGIAGAYALVLAARSLVDAQPTLSAGGLLERLRPIAGLIDSARPTAVNLAVAVAASMDVATQSHSNAHALAAALLAEAERLAQHERTACGAIARHGAAWIEDRIHRQATDATPIRCLTHCNAGALVTTGLGTALAPIYLLHAHGVPVAVFADETRPLLQGMRLTAYELGRAGIQTQVLADGAAAALMAGGGVDLIIVGADRICANGDVTNKVGTYGLAVLAKAHDLPFLVAAPASTIDLASATGAAVPIEQRPDDAACYLADGCLPPGIGVFAPAFDVTPAALVTTIFTERGVVDLPTEGGLKALVAEERPA